MQTLKQMFKTQTLLVQHVADVKHLQSADISVAMGQRLQGVKCFSPLGDRTTWTHRRTCCLLPADRSQLQAFREQHKSLIAGIINPPLRCVQAAMI